MNEEKIKVLVNNVLYFGDPSDYETALWEVLEMVAPETKPENIDYIELI